MTTSDPIFLVYPYQVTDGTGWIYKGEKSECEEFLKASKNEKRLDTSDWIIEENDEDMVIISPKWTKKGIYTFWRAGNAGYTEDFRQAWVYKYSDVKKNLQYYHNGDGAIAIPKFAIEKFFINIHHVEVNKKLMDEYMRLFKLHV